MPKSQLCDCRFTFFLLVFCIHFHANKNAGLSFCTREERKKKEYGKQIYLVLFIIVFYIAICCCCCVALTKTRSIEYNKDEQTEYQCDVNIAGKRKEENSLMRNIF